MARRLKIPVRSFGSEVGTPTVEELAEWVAQRRGIGGDLVTCQLEISLEPQGDVDIPCAGGMFYGRRWRDCLVGFREGVLVDEPDIDPREVIDDALALAARRKGVWVSLPAPHLLGLQDAYVGDAEEFQEILAGLYARLAREMRDQGVRGHVLISEAAQEVELDELAARRIVFFPKDPETFDFETLLEYQTELVVLPQQIGTAAELMEEYRIRRLILLNPESGDLAAATEYADPEMLQAGGYCERDCTDYWRGVTEQAFIPR